MTQTPEPPNDRIDRLEAAQLLIRAANQARAITNNNQRIDQILEDLFRQSGSRRGEEQ